MSTNERFRTHVRVSRARFLSASADYSSGLRTPIRHFAPFEAARATRRPFFVFKGQKWRPHCGATAKLRRSTMGGPTEALGYIVRGLAQQGRKGYPEPRPPGRRRAARGLLAWTQNKLARVAGVSIVTVRNFETEKTTPLGGRFVLEQGARRNWDRDTRLAALICRGKPQRAPAPDSSRPKIVAEMVNGGLIRGELGGRFRFGGGEAGIVTDQSVSVSPRTL
jgi:hypothetical protein